MKQLTRLFLSALFLWGILFIFPQPAQAQGTYECGWEWFPPPPLGGCKGPKTQSCDIGYTNAGCVEISPFSCGTKNCVLAAPGGAGANVKPTLVGCPAGGQGIDTALGCIPTDDLNGFVGWFLSWAIGIGGGIAFLLILWSGFQIMTSTGNPDRLKAGKEQLTSAVSGLLFIVFSVFLLKLIGVEILKIPGF